MFNFFEFCQAEKWDSREDLEASDNFFFLYRGCDRLNDDVKSTRSETKDAREKRITGAMRERNSEHM